MLPLHNRLKMCSIGTRIQNETKFENADVVFIENPELMKRIATEQV